MHARMRRANMHDYEEDEEEKRARGLHGDQSGW